MGIRRGVPNVADQHRPDHVDRFATPRTNPTDPRRAHRATAGNAGGDRPGRCRRTSQHADRPATADQRGHRAQVAPPLVCGTGDSIAGRCETVRPSTGVHRRAGGPGQGDGLHTASRQRPAAVAVVVPGAGAPRRRRRDRRVTSPATVRRWLSEDAIKPWQYRSWIFITDPDFAVKAQRVLDLYDRTWKGKPLGAGDYVVSADEK